MLNIDKFFVSAISTDQNIKFLVSGRIFDPARYEIDEQEDKIPYIIIAYESGSADADDKDSVMAELSSATVSILVVAKDRGALATLVEKVHSAIGSAFDDEEFYDSHDDWNFYITDCTPSAGSVELDPTKPCCYQTLTYNCNTIIR